MYTLQFKGEISAGRFCVSVFFSYQLNFICILNHGKSRLQTLVFIDDIQVDDVTADLVIGQLLFLDAEDQEKDIKLFINSPGGSVTAGMSERSIY